MFHLVVGQGFLLLALVLTLAIFFGKSSPVLLLPIIILVLLGLYCKYVGNELLK